MSFPEKKRKTATKKPLLKPSLTLQSTPNPSLSLPDDLLLSCFARVSRLYYPTLSLVSKSLRSLITSAELYKTRSLLNREERCLYVCLKLPSDSNPRWFTLCRKPNHPRKKKNKTSGNVLVPVPFPQSSHPTHAASFVAVGSDIYEIGGLINDRPSPNVSALDCRSLSRNQAPNMLKARKNPTVYAIDGKLCVDGDSIDSVSSNYIEVFDPKTQTWKLEDRTPFAIDIKECRLGTSFSGCWIDNVYMWYGYRQFEWYDANELKWKILKGMEGQLPKFTKYCDVQLANYGGKMAVLWDKHDRSSNDKGKVIWCAEIALEICNEEISGKVEWFGPVLKVPKLFRFMCVLDPTL
ncbi:Kelch-type beta propeller [Arabidopsis suecica]|uniref:Kelch-type beta propeller n=1 Tax=Arabidopsis suecica TaxID=45249 RepID=A0A8T1YPI5_ARASU|nr:Kelch-type beta propeller [Arabidopsis suecica]